MVVNLSFDIKKTAILRNWISCTVWGKCSRNIQNCITFELGKENKIHKIVVVFSKHNKALSRFISRYVHH